MSPKDSGLSNLAITMFNTSCIVCTEYLSTKLQKTPWIVSDFKFSLIGRKVNKKKTYQPLLPISQGTFLTLVCWKKHYVVAKTIRHECIEVLCGFELESNLGTTSFLNVGIAYYSAFHLENLIQLSTSYFHYAIFPFWQFTFDAYANSCFEMSGKDI